MSIQTSDIALFGNPELTGLVSFNDYIDALVEATQLVDKNNFTENERKAFNRFVEVVRQNAKAAIGMGSVWMQPQKGDWSRDKFKWMQHYIPTAYIFQPPKKNVSSSLAIVMDGERAEALLVVAKNVANFLSKKTVITLLETARKRVNHILVEITDTDLIVTKPVPKDFVLIEGGEEEVPEEGEEAVPEEFVERYGFPHDFIGNGDLTKKLELAFDQFEDGETWEELKARATSDDGGFEKFESLSFQELATVRTFFKKLRKALKNTAESGSESSEGDVISINGNVLDIAEDAGDLTEFVADGIDRYLEMNRFQLLNPLTISLGGDGADVNVEVDADADLRTQVRSALRQISVPLARELEYSVYGFDSDAFEVAGELAYFAGFN